MGQREAQYQGHFHAWASKKGMRLKKHTPLLAPRTTQFLKEWAVAAETSNCVPWIHYTARVAWIALWSANKLSHTAYCWKRLSDLSALGRAAEDESAAWLASRQLPRKAERLRPFKGH